MASTRNKNTQGDYKFQQRNNVLADAYKVNEYGKSYRDARPTQNINYGKLSRETLSDNPIDIETQLFGIGSTNLVNPKTDVRPELNSIGYVDFTDPKNMVHAPEMIIMNNQRPLMR